MRNCPDFLAIWLGFTRVGVRVALLNTHLRDRSLAHCIDCRRAAPARSLDSELAAAFDTALPHLAAVPALVRQGDSAQAGATRQTLAQASAPFAGAPLAEDEAPGAHASATRRC